jgi:rhamnose utilization protein RhaD (predicted bifunctional aldolase and dehydrogenase)
MNKNMNKNRSATNQAELTPLRELCPRIGGDPLLTQAGTGNSSIKLEGVLWITASGEWMANAIHEDILIPLDLAEVKERVKHKVDPAERQLGYLGADYHRCNRSHGIVAFRTKLKLASGGEQI